MNSTSIAMKHDRAKNEPEYFAELEKHYEGHKDPLKCEECAAYFRAKQVG